MKKIKEIAILCAGLDDVMRGYETHTRLLFNSLLKENIEGIEFKLYKRTGKKNKIEKPLHTFSRDSKIVRFLAKFRGTNFYWESLFFSLKFIFHTLIRFKKFDKILVIEPMVGRTLLVFKFLMKGKPTIILTHGVSMEPKEYIQMGDVFHQVSIENYKKQVSYFKENKINKETFLIPHFINDTSDNLKQTKEELRNKFGIQTKKVLLSVGVINRSKNMEYIIRETNKLSKDWTLVLCGKIGESDLIKLGKELLGKRFIHLFVNRNDIPEVYAVADLFVLASIQEGFGIVSIEAMSAGLPVILHDKELFRWILKDDTVCIDMTKENALSSFINNKLINNPNWFKEKGISNRKLFENNYSWTAVKKEYLNLLLTK